MSDPKSSNYSTGGSADNGEDSTDKVNILEQEMLKMRANIDKLIKSVGEYSQFRYKEAQIQHSFGTLFNDRADITGADIKESMNSFAKTSLTYHDDCIQNRKEIEEGILYEAESHLMWVDSIIDLLQRRKELKSRLETVTHELKNGGDDAQYDYGNESIELEKRIAAMTKGIYAELALLKGGTKDFLMNKLREQFISKVLTF